MNLVEVWPHHTGHMSQIVVQTTGFMWPFMARWDMGVNIDLSCGRTMDPNMVFGSSPGLLSSIVPSSSKGSPDQYGPSSSMEYGLNPRQRRPRSPESTQPSTAPEATDINTDHGYCRTRKPIWALTSAQLDISILAPGDKQICPSAYF